jgi:DNA-binding FadR family transcriptional regulator
MALPDNEGRSGPMATQRATFSVRKDALDPVVSDGTATGPDGRTKLRSLRLPELMAADIRRQILEKQLAPGQALPSEAELIAQYGVSRPSLREAMRVLESEQLIVVRRGKGGGAIIRAPDLDQAARQLGFVMQDRGVTLGDVHRARTIIEPPALAALAAAATPEQLAELEGLVSEAAATLDEPRRFRSLTGVLREKMVEMTGAVTATLIMRLLRELLEMQGGGGFAPERLDRLNRTSLKSHQRLLQLIADGDPEAVEVFWRKHLSKAGLHLEGRATHRLVDLTR